MKLYFLDSNFLVHREIRKISWFRKANSKIYYGQCIIREGSDYFNYPFVLIFNGHFADIPCDLHYALGEADFELLPFKGNYYSKYFDSCGSFESIIVARMHV